MPGAAPPLYRCTVKFPRSISSRGSSAEPQAPPNKWGVHRVQSEEWGTPSTEKAWIWFDLVKLCFEVVKNHGLIWFLIWFNMVWSGLIWFDLVSYALKWWKKNMVWTCLDLQKYAEATAGIFHMTGSPQRYLRNLADHLFRFVGWSSKLPQLTGS